MEEQEVKNWMWSERYNHLVACHINVSTLTDAAFEEFGEHYDKEDIKALAVEISGEHLDRMKEYCD